MNDKIEYLKNSPIYAMSLGSKELFHSNFWAWLMRKNPYMINVFFERKITSVKKDNKGDFIINDNPPVNPEKLIQREYKNRDITINLSDGVYIIENKIKTLPDKEQLLKYQYSANNFKNGCYTGLENPNFDESEVTFEVNKQLHTRKFEDDRWHFLDYKDISKKIREIVDNTKFVNNKKFFDSFEIEIIKQYCSAISNLNCIISKKLKNDKNNFSFKTDKNLAKIGIDDVYKKLKADKTMKIIERNIKRKDGYEINEFTFKIEKGFSNNAPLISFKYIYKYNNDIKNVYSIGVQIQNNVLKRYAETKNGKVNLLEGGYDNFFEIFATIGLFDAAYNPESKTINFAFHDNTEERDTNMTPKKGNENKITKQKLVYNAYNDFVYQQMIIPDDISKLKNEINRHLEYIESILSDAKKVFKNM